MPRLATWIARLACLLRALAAYASETLLASGSLMALMLLAVSQRVWLIAWLRQTLTALLSFGADSSDPR